VNNVDIGLIIAAWASGKAVKIMTDDGWLGITPDNLHGQTDEKEWVTLREAIARYDNRQEAP
jgi:hypothetical protein